MVFNDAPELRTENKLLLRYEGITQDSLLQFRILSGFTSHYGVTRSAIETEEIIFLENTETMQEFVNHVSDAFFLFGEFQILTNYKTNIISLHTVFYYENFCWRYMPAKLVFSQ